MKAPRRAEHWEMEVSDPKHETLSWKVGRVELGNELATSTCTPAPTMKVKMKLLRFRVAGYEVKPNIIPLGLGSYVLTNWHMKYISDMNRLVAETATILSANST